jgi:dihydrofolate synthase/folylpolyglutamate synthase
MMNYTEFLAYIYQRYSGNVKLGLDRMEGILTDMQHPEQKLKGIHIGGTNGKGSTSATCEALALAHTLHTGLNTSPHLIDFCERFRFDGQNVQFREVVETFHRFEEIFTRWDASFFEITTAIAFQLFVDKSVNTSIFEVGLGGRLDATNLFTPEVAVITTIGLDHIKTLGDTVEKIAFEKAGIVKPGVPLVLGRIPASPLSVILEQAQSKQALVYQIDRDFTIRNIKNTAEGVSFDYAFGSHFFPALKTNLLGKHQAINVANAVTAFLLYCERTGTIPQEQQIRFALRHIHWMGRMQLLQNEPIVIIDGAHNQQGIEVLCENIAELFPGKKLLFVISILADKDYVRMLQSLCPYAKRFYISKNDSDRAAEIEQQTEVVQAMGIEFVTAPTVKEAYQIALADAGKDDVIIGGGSLYTVGEILSSVNSR